MLTIVAKFFILDVCASSSKDSEYDFSRTLWVRPVKLLYQCVHKYALKHNVVTSLGYQLWQLDSNNKQPTVQKGYVIGLPLLIKLYLF